MKIFEPYPRLSGCVSHVLASLPPSVQNDFLANPSFRISLDDCEPGRGRTVLVAAPSPSHASQCVVLKPRLESCSEAFVCYIVAHELAHARLNNGGWGEITDREEAADALAKSWGFEKLAYE